jgi:hypothetical protein
MDLQMTSASANVLITYCLSLRTWRLATRSPVATATTRMVGAGEEDKDVEVAADVVAVVGAGEAARNLRSTTTVLPVWCWIYLAVCELLHLYAKDIATNMWSMHNACIM